MGEGLRNTVSLTGRGGMAHGFLHWSANFDEVQDFEGQIRSLAGGTGLMTDAAFATRTQPLGATKAGVSADLDALAAYVASLTTFTQSPHRNADGSLTTLAAQGRTVFQNANCGFVPCRHEVHGQRGRGAGRRRHDQAAEQRSTPQRDADGHRSADAARCVGNCALSARRLCSDAGRCGPCTHGRELERDRRKCRERVSLADR